MKLVRLLRERLERTVRDPNFTLLEGVVWQSPLDRAIIRAMQADRLSAERTQAWRVKVLTRAIQMAVA
jgi:hypothetical protein